MHFYDQKIVIITNFRKGHGHPVPQPGHGMMPSNSGSAGSQQPARPMIPSGSDPHLPSRPMHSGGSQSQGQTQNRPSPPSGSDPSRPMQSGGGQIQPQIPNRPSGGDTQSQMPNRPSSPSGSDPSRPMQSGGGQIQPQTPNRPSGGDPQSQSPGRPTQTHPTRPGRPPVTQQVLNELKFSATNWLDEYIFRVCLFLLIISFTFSPYCF